MRFSLFRQQIESRLKQEQSRRAKLRGKRLRVEGLEDRRLLAGDTTVSPAQLDVNHDGQVTPLDALLIISDLNKNGARAISSSSDTTDSASSSSGGLQELSLVAGGSPSASTDSSLDVNGDGFITPMDALLVIKQLNDVPAQAAITLQATDLSGNPITQIQVGQKFELRAFIQDVRTGIADPGIFSAYTDVTFNGSLASVQSIVHTSAQDPNPSPPVFNYGNGLSGDFSTSGLLDEAGGFQTSSSPLGAGNLLLFAAEMTATTAGPLTFTADPADILPLHDTDTFDPANPVPTTQISYGTTSLTVVDQPTLTAAPVQVFEGDSGTTAMTFNLQLSGDNSTPVTVHYSTSDGTATSTGPNADYQPITDTLLTFPAHTTSMQVTVNVNGDLLNEPDETLSLNLFNATGAIIGTPSVTGTILNDDAPPTVTIGDTSVTEGTALTGFTPMTFNVALSAPSGQTVTVNYSVNAGTATFGNDYTGPTSGVVTFLPGQVSQAIVVDIVPDALNETNETLQVQLSTPTNSTLGATSTATGTIIDDDAPPSISVNDASVAEPASGTSNLVFNVSLSAPSGQTVTVAYNTADVTTTAGADYVPASGTLTFLPGQTTLPVTVLVNADNLQEPNETLDLLLTSPTNATIADGTGVGTISDFVGNDVVRVRLQATDMSGNPITSVLGGALFKLNAYVEDLRQPESSSSGIFAAYMDVNFDGSHVVGVGPITYGPDFQNVPSGSITTGELDEIGATATSIPTPNGAGEHLLYSVVVQGIAGGTASFTPDPAQGVGHDILLYGSSDPVPDDEVDFEGTGPIQISAPPLLSVNSPSITEGNSGLKNLTFTVSLSPGVTDPTTPVSVNYATVDGTATAGSDYQSVTNTLIFAPGQTSATINVPIIGDTLNEANETFNLQLSSSVNAIIQTGVGVGTILNDDAAPTVSVSNASALQGVSNATFQVSLSAPSGQVITVQYATASGTATDGVDYTHSAGTLTFLPGQTTKSVTVNVALSPVAEGPETFLFNLSSPTIASLGVAQGVGTITQLPSSSLSGNIYTDANNDGLREAGELGIAGVTVTLVGTDFFGRSVNRQVVTDSSGVYQFTGLTAGSYTIRDFAPVYVTGGIDTIGSLGGSNPASDTFTVVIDSGVAGQNYNFGKGGIDPFLFWTSQFT